MSEIHSLFGNELETIHAFITSIIQDMHKLLNSKLVAVYLHGSIATGDFVPNKSDLDLVAICQATLSMDEKAVLLEWFAKSMPPQILNGIDCAILSRQAAAEPARPPAWEIIIRGQRNDHEFVFFIPSDITGYSCLDLTMARERGLTLTGPSPSTLIAPLPRTWLLADCIANVQIWANRDVFYAPDSGVLTACRAWLYLDTNQIGTKTEAGSWAISQSPTFSTLIKDALALHHNTPGGTLSNLEVKAFCQHVLQRLFAHNTSDALI